MITIKHKLLGGKYLNSYQNENEHSIDYPATFRQIYCINAFHTKLQQSLYIMYPGFGQDVTRLKYFHHVT